MERSEVKFRARDQVLTFTGGIRRYASDTVNYVEAYFELQDNWSGFDVIAAVWNNGSARIATDLDSDGKCRVPQEVLSKKGDVYVNLTGTTSAGNAVTERLTSYPVWVLSVDAKSHIRGTETAAVTPSQFEQFVSIVISEVEKVTGMTAQAETLPAGSQATARYENGILYLGIPQGIQGERGETGADGADGNGIASVVYNADYSLTLVFDNGERFTTPPITGETGATPQLSIGTVTTTTEPSVTITGTAENPVLNFGLVKGDKGDTGDVSQEQLDAAVSDLKSELTKNVLPRTSYNPAIIQGSYDGNGNPTAAQNRIRTKGFIHMNAGDGISFEKGTNIDGIFVGKFDTSKHFVSESAGWNTNTAQIYASEECYIILAFKRSDNANITPSDFDASLTWDSNISSQIQKAKCSTVSHPILEIGGIYTNGAPYVTNSGLRTKDYIPTKSERITITFPTTTYLKVSFYDEDKNFIYQTGNQENGIYTFCSDNGYYKFDLTMIAGGSYAESISWDAVSVESIPLNTYRFDVSLERGLYDTGFTRSNRVDYYKAYVRNAYDILSNDATWLLIDRKGYRCFVYFIDSSGTNLRTVDSNNEKGIISIPLGTKYVNIEMVTTDQIDSVSVTFFSHSDIIPCEVKRRPVPVDAVDGCEYNTIKVNDDICTTIRLMLPPNYSALGAKVPLVLYLSGSGSFTQWNYPIEIPAQVNNLQYVRDEGFAVLSVFGWGSNLYADYPNCGAAQHYPTPTNLACLKAGLEYVCDRYNVDAKNVHIMCKSQGGQGASYFVTNPIWDFRSIGMFAPVLDYLSMPGDALYADTRKALVADLGLTGNTAYFTSNSYVSYSSDGQAFLRDNMIKIAGMNEAFTGLVGDTLANNYEKALSDCETFWTESRWLDPTQTDIYNHPEYVKIGKVPVKIWGGNKDDNTPYLKEVEFVAQLQNGGTEASLVTYINGGHSTADISDKTDVTTALGIECTDVGTGWIANVAWARQKMAK